MKQPVFLLIVYLGTFVAADGRRGAMDRLWLWYAYQIDLLNPPADRIVGYRCSNFDEIRTNTCIGEWQACVGTQTAPGKERSCTFKELMVNLGPENFPRNIAGPDERTLTPDIESTATRIQTKRLGKNYKPFNIVKGSRTGYNPMLVAVGKQVGRTRLRLTADQLAANQQFFDLHDTALEKIELLRQIDHSSHIGRDTQLHMAEKGFSFTSQYENLGPDPVTRRPQRLFDLELSVIQNSHIPVVRERLLLFLDNHYSAPPVGDRDARGHKVVMDSFSMARNMANGIGCGAF